MHGTRLIELGSHNQRAALGSLLMYPNTVVPTTRLVTALWGPQAPPMARKTLQNAVAGLRDLLEESRTELLTKSPGYVLKVDPDDVDLVRFRRLAQRGRAELDAGQNYEAARTLYEALSLWRGDVLADLAESGISWPELDSLQEERLAAFEGWVQAALATGHHSVVLGELEAAYEADPRRQRLCGQFMLALYRSGRQAEAIEVFARTSKALAEDVPVEIAAELRELEQAIRLQDPALTLAEDNCECYVRTALCPD